MASTVKYISIYRIAKTSFIADKTGKGAFLHGGRWNPKGYQALYASESRALALQEFLVNTPTTLLPSKLSIREIKIPYSMKISSLEMKNLGKKWRRQKSKTCEDIGKKWFDENETAVLKVPSAIIPEEFNYILNTRHPDFKNIKFCKSQVFIIDERIIRREV